ncbi:protein SICKLE-like isoform X1 [Coffea arabica]|uniref:Protein SICKLE-like isoform X1 n=2 Tax=Coffea arabica TaxID=13443 RepID=A0ABM4X2J4_COFAR
MSAAMEESEKRKERLNALRREADQAGVHGDSENFMGASYTLANPLIEASVPPSVHAELQAAPRFDYYTDPMSAFSANKRGKVSHQISPDYFTPPRPVRPDMTNPWGHPAYQAQATYCADQSMFQSPRPYHRPGPFRSPRGTPSPFGTPEGGGSSGTPPYVSSNFSRGGSVGSPGFAPGGSPSFNDGHIRGYGCINSPESGFGNFGSPYPNSGRGQSRWLGNNSPQASGRGRGRGQGYNAPVSANSGRRVGSHDFLSAEHNPGRFYNKSMVEDPWATLKPVIWRRKDAPTLGTHHSKKSWLPESIRGKKAQVSEVSHKYSSGRSFAEDLAASFHAATNYESADDNDDGNDFVE